MTGRVLVISQLPPPIHGSTIMTQTFLRTLDELGCEWRLVDRRFSSSVAEVGRFSFRKLLSAAWMPFRLLWAMWHFRPHSVVFFATNRTFSFLVDWALSEVLRWFRARRVLYLHTVGFAAVAARNGVLAWFVTRLLGSGDTVVCLGPRLAEDIRGWVGDSRIAYIPNAVTDVPPPSVDDKSRSSVLFFSNLIPEKGAGAFVNLAIGLAPQLPDTPFVVAGAPADPAFEASLKRMVKDAGLGARITFTGAVTDATVKWRMLREAAVLVFPSTYPFEAQPLTIVEALAVGTPVVAYDVGGVSDLLRGTALGRVVDACDIAAIAEEARNRVSAPSSGACTEDSSAAANSLAGYVESWRDQLRVRDAAGPQAKRE